MRRCWAPAILIGGILVGGWSALGRALPARKPAAPAAAQPAHAGPAGAREAGGVDTVDSVYRDCAYRLEHPGVQFNDLVRLADGTLRIGKALPWGAHVLFFDQHGHAARLSAADVAAIEPRITANWNRRPTSPDLTVAFVEQLPRRTHWHGRVRMDSPDAPGLPVVMDTVETPRPKDGDEVTFVVHIRNDGGGRAGPFEYRIRIDGQRLKNDTVMGGLGAGMETRIEIPWPWSSDARRIEIDVDPGGAVKEHARWNNTFVDEIHALGVVVVAPKAVVEAFGRQRNLVDTFSMADWAQYQVRHVNRLFADSVHPGAPQGITERIRLDRILVVDESNLNTWRTALHRSGDLDEPIEYAATLMVGMDHAAAAAGEPTSSNGPASDPGAMQDADKTADATAGTADVSAGSATPSPKPTSAVAARSVDTADRNEITTAARDMVARIDASFQRDLLFYLGLMDLTAWDCSARACLVREADGTYVHVGHHAPARGGLAVAARFLELDAMFLNAIRGRPRGVRADWRLAFPRSSALEIRDPGGRPLAGVRVELFERAVSGDRAGFVGADPIAIGTTDREGLLPLPNRSATSHTTPNGFALVDNPFGAIDLRGPGPLLLARLTRGTWTEYHYVPSHAFNAAALRGDESYAHVLNTGLAGDGGPSVIDSTRLWMPGEARGYPFPAGHVLYRWPHWGDGPGKPMEYRVFQRFGYDGVETAPWMLIDVVPPNPKGPIPQPHASLVKLKDGNDARPMRLAVARVDEQGRMGEFSVRAPMPAAGTLGRMAMIDGEVAFVPIDAERDTPVMRVTDIRRSRPFGPFGLRVLDPKWRDYVPAAAGAALDEAGLLILADHRNHQVAWFEDGVLKRLVGAASPDGSRDERAAGSGDGEFNSPSDVAVDSSGRVYVADRINHRVCVLDGEGNWLRSFGGQGVELGQLNEPFALGMSGDVLAVTGAGDKRVTVYDVGGEEPIARFKIDFLIDPDRAVVSDLGRVYVCDVDGLGNGCIRVYPAGGGAMERMITETRVGPLRRPRGLMIFHTETEAGKPAMPPMAYVVTEFPYQLMWFPVDAE